MELISSEFVALGVGIVAGCLHVLTGPDHLAAVAPLIVTHRQRGARLGALWGLGHGLGVLLLGALLVALRTQIDLNAVSNWLEGVVGLMLIGIGVWGFRRARSDAAFLHRSKTHKQGHTHEHVQGRALFSVGVLHGAAGGGHVLGVLPALALEAGPAIAYLTAYMFGALLTMSLYGGLLGRMANIASRPQRLRHMLMAVSVLAVGIGVFWTLSVFSAEA